MSKDDEIKELRTKLAEAKKLAEQRLHAMESIRRAGLRGADMAFARFPRSINETDT